MVSLFSILPRSEMFLAMCQKAEPMGQLDLTDLLPDHSTTKNDLTIETVGEVDSYAAPESVDAEEARYVDTYELVCKDTKAEASDDGSVDMTEVLDMTESMPDEFILEGEDTKSEIKEAFVEPYMDAYEEICVDTSLDVADGEIDEVCIENITEGLLALIGYTGATKEEVIPKTEFVNLLASDETISPLFVSVEFYLNKEDVPEYAIMLCDFTYSLELLGEVGCTDEPAPIAEADILEADPNGSSYLDWQMGWWLRKSGDPLVLSTFIMNYFGEGNYNAGLAIYIPPLTDPMTEYPDCSYLFNTYACSL